MSLAGLFTGMRTVATGLLGVLPFRCFLLAPPAPSQTDEAGFPAGEYLPTTAEAFACGYTPVTGKEVLINGKPTTFTGYQVQLPAGATVDGAMRVRLLATDTDGQRDFTIAFVGEQQGVLRDVYCTLVEE